jgi:hypothetical protein
MQRTSQRQLRPMFNNIGSRSGIAPPAAAFVANASIANALNPVARHLNCLNEAICRRIP